MFCSKCGKQLPDDAVKCDECGAEVRSVGAIVDLLDKKGVMLNRWIDGGLDWLRKLPFESVINVAEKFFSRIGIFSFYLLGLVGLVGGIVAAIRYEYITPLWIGICWLLLCILFAYFGTKLLQSIKALVMSTKGVFSSQALLDCITLLFLLSGVVALVMGIYFACDEADSEYLWQGIIGFIGCEFVTICALEPKLVSTEAGIACSPGEELIGLVTFFIKVMLRMLPFIWCLGAFFTMIYVIVHLGAENLNVYLSESFELTLLLGIAPVVYYLGFLIYYFVIDLARAVLSLPGKLDKLDK